MPGGNAEGSYTQNAIRIIVGPIKISGVPFWMWIYFYQASGLAIDQPDKVITENHWNYSFPLVMGKVELISDSAFLLDDVDKREYFYKLVKSKYKRLIKHNGYQYFWAYDKYGNYFKIELESTRCLIEYVSYTYINNLTEVYRKHLVEIESKNNKHKPDMSSGL